VGARPRQSLVETVGDVDTVADELAPERVGRYEIDRVLGRGAMGTVYLARDPSLDRKIAIKVLTPTLNRRKRSRRTARLVREAQAMARVAHGNTIEVLDVGVDGEGDVERVFIAMEYVDGGTLEEWLGAEVRTWREILTVFVAVGEALQAIHGAGLLHRDFKPDNVLMTADGRPIVTDFGLARLLGEEEEEDTASLGEGPTSRTERPTGQTGQTEGPPSVTARRWVDLTATGSALGTPRFMAPEQHLRGDLDARADQFAFCVALHRALFGTFPFEGQTLGELAANVADGRRVSPPPSFVPRRVRRAIFRGLSRRPQDRFADMGALVERVRIDGPRGRSRRVVAAVALVGMGATIALAVAAEGIRTPSARETAPAETALRTGELCSVAWPDSPPALQALSPASEAGRTYLRAWEERRRQWTYAHDFYCAGTAWATPAAGQLVCLDHARIQAEARFAVFATALPSEAGRLRREVERAPEPDWCLDSPYPFDTVGVSQLPNMVTIATQVVEAEALASLGRTEHASELIARTTDRIGTIEAPVLEARVWSAHGMIAAERGDYEAAAASYRTTPWCVSSGSSASTRDGQERRFLSPRSRRPTSNASRTHRGCGTRCSESGRRSSTPRASIASRCEGSGRPSRW
jgi:serine/threonine protein kinase